MKGKQRKVNTKKSLADWNANRQFSLDDYLVSFNKAFPAAVRDHIDHDGRDPQGPYRAARQKADQTVLKAVIPSWRALRDLVWERDKGICQVCLRIIDPSDYELGHLNDRCEGGTDTPDNVMVMCWVCNHFKPFHATAEEARAWLSEAQSVGGTIFLIPKVRALLPQIEKEGINRDYLFAMMR